MRKKIFALITVIALVAVLAFGLVACNTSGNDAGQDDDLTDNSRGDKISNENNLLEYRFWDTYSAWIVSGIGDYTGEALTIPQTYRGLDVIAIGVEAFKGCATLRSVVIHDNIQYIRNSAFQDCTNLEKITLDSNSNIMVYPDAFENTAWYNTQPKGVVYLDGIALNYKGEMPNNTRIELENDTRIITCGAFFECPNLTSIKLNKNLRIIGEDAFTKCANLSEVDASQCDVNYIASSAFTGTAWLTNQNRVVYIGNALYKYNGTMPDNTEIEIKDGTTHICRDAFYGCTGLTSITIPDSVVKIDDYAFEDCANLTSITIPVSVTSIGDEAFAYCENLNTIIFGGTPAQWEAISKGSEWDYNTRNYTIYYSAIGNIENCLAGIEPIDFDNSMTEEDIIEKLENTKVMAIEIVADNGVRYVYAKDFICECEGPAVLRFDFVEGTRYYCFSSEGVDITDYAGYDTVDLNDEFVVNIDEFIYELIANISLVSVENGNLYVSAEGLSVGIYDTAPIKPNISEAYKDYKEMPVTRDVIEFELSEDETYYTLTNISRFVKTYEVPESFSGKPVTRFDDNISSNLKTLTLSSNIVYLNSSCKHNAEYGELHIIYNGTKAQWEAIENSAVWSATKGVRITCSDGDYVISTEE